MGKRSDFESNRESKVEKRNMRLKVEDEEDFDSDSDDNLQGQVFVQKKTEAIDRFQDEDEEEEYSDVDVEDEDSQEVKEVEEENEVDGNEFNVKSIKGVGKLSPEKLEKEQKRIKKTGVCYLSKIPPYMKPAKLRSVLSRFGKIDRLFLKPEDSAIYHKRVKYGGNKKKSFTEGWIEFVNKKDAKLCASTLNANILGGKKTSFYYDDVINMKYLSGFKWFDLTQQIAKENEIRQAKLTLELSQQSKLNKAFVSNVAKSKMISNIQKKRKERDPDAAKSDKDIEMRRNFKQRKVTSTRADAHDDLKHRAKPNEKLNSVLNKVF